MYILEPLMFTAYINDKWRLKRLTNHSNEFPKTFKKTVEIEHSHLTLTTKKLLSSHSTNNY